MFSLSLGRTVILPSVFIANFPVCKTIVFLMVKVSYAYCIFQHIDHLDWIFQHVLAL